MWRRFLRLTKELANRKNDCSDLMFLSHHMFVSPLREILEDVQNQGVNTLNPESDISLTCFSVPFDIDQPFFTSINERPPSPTNSAISFFGSKSENEIRTVTNSESTDTGSSQWLNTTQLSSEERLFLVETIHTILSKQTFSDQTPSTLSSRSLTVPHLQPLSHSPLFFSSSIFDLDDTSLTDCLGQLAKLAQYDQISNHCELSQSFVDGLVSCLGSSNKILSNRARLVMTRHFPLFFPFLLSHVDSLSRTLSEGTSEERAFAIQVMGRAIETGFTPKWISEAIIHQICQTSYVDPRQFIDALLILSVQQSFPSFHHHSPTLVESFGVFVDASMDMTSRLWESHAKEDTSEPFLRNACLSLFVYHTFAFSRRHNLSCLEEVVELLLHPHFFSFELKFLHYTSILFLQTFPFDLLFERMIRSCQFADVLRGLHWWIDHVVSRSFPLRDLFSTLHPFFLRGFHQILLHPPPPSSSEARQLSELYKTIQELFVRFAKSPFNSLLPHLFPVENLLTMRAQLLTVNLWSDNLLIDDLFVISFTSFTPFGECHALRSIFAILCLPGVQSEVQSILELLEHIAVVSSHSLPLQFDSPLLAFVQTLHPLISASREEIRWFFEIVKISPARIGPTPLWTETNALDTDKSLIDLHHAPHFILQWLHPFHLTTTLKNLLSLSPVQVSLALLALSRTVAASSKACLWLIYCNAVDVVVEIGSRHEIIGEALN
ncbi:hypothetical protein BLNAU_1632 [Blattamonas nauphoetae]|uniref:Uncharacterized protein n=1 Tax=Blattamonas nauphoetae TaxID=2049346 RepID=A0ABQ9YJ12_9EUKA|nr:hypothetical protein BLNAU_1632 [Blattamonas nauphoetae]